MRLKDSLRRLGVRIRIDQKVSLIFTLNFVPYVLKRYSPQPKGHKLGAGQCV